MDQVSVMRSCVSCKLFDCQAMGEERQDPSGGLMYNQLLGRCGRNWCAARTRSILKSLRSTRGEQQVLPNVLREIVSRDLVAICATRKQISTHPPKWSTSEAALWMSLGVWVQSWQPLHLKGLVLLPHACEQAVEACNAKKEHPQFPSLRLPPCQIRV